MGTWEWGVLFFACPALSAPRHCNHNRLAIPVVTHLAVFHSKRHHICKHIATAKNRNYLQEISLCTLSLGKRIADTNKSSSRNADLRSWVPRCSKPPRNSYNYKPGVSTEHRTSRMGPARGTDGPVLGTAGAVGKPYGVASPRWRNVFRVQF